MYYLRYYPGGPHLERGFLKAINLKGEPQQAHFNSGFIIFGIEGGNTLIILCAKAMISRSFGMEKVLFGLRNP